MKFFSHLVLLFYLYILKHINFFQTYTYRFFSLIAVIILFSFSTHASALSCSASADTWGDGYVVNVTVNNDSSSSISAWQVTLSHEESPNVSSSWNANTSTSGNQVTASNVGWNGSLSPGQSTSFGYQGSHSGNFRTPTCSGGTDAPTPQPTATPTAQPTPEPTSQPTAEPTQQPTAEPTPEPTSPPNTSNKLTIEENTSGFCGVEGSVDNNNAGFSGTGFANTENATGKSITWSINVENSGNYDLSWRFANGSSSNRSANIYVNNNVQAATNFNGTGAWSTWQDSETITVYLNSGQNTLRASADTAGGLANIDYVTVFGSGLSAGNCATSKEPTPTPTAAPTATPTANPTQSPPGGTVTTGSRPTIWYASDSTVRHYDQSYEIQQGVGQRLPEFLTNEVSIANYAKGGRAVNSFISDGFWGQIMDRVQAGDVIFIQFGINDRSDVPDKEVFKSYLRRYVEEARAKQAIPVFVTPTPRNQHSNGVFTNAFTKYCDAKFEVGEEMNVTVVDLQTKGRDFYTEIGPSRVSSEMMIDTLHLGISGAYHMARLLAEGIAESNLYPLRDYVIRENLDPNRTPTVDGWVPRAGYTYN